MYKGVTSEILILVLAISTCINMKFFPLDHLISHKFKQVTS